MVQVGPNGSTSFVPSTISINVNDTVMWDWPAGSLPHTVTSGTPGNADGKFCSNGGTQSAAACNSTSYAVAGPHSYSHQFTAAGTYPYYCTIHGAAMTGTVTVHAAGSSGGGGGTTGGGGSGY
jgi:plastocyanin